MADRVFMMDEHTGTHFDAPFHFDPDGPTVEKLPVNRFLGPAKLVDVSSRKPDEEVSRAMIETAAAEQDVKIKSGEILILRTTRAKWGSPEYLKHTSIGKTGAEAIVEYGVNAVGMDMHSADTMWDLSKPAHTMLCKARIPIFENLVNLESIRAKSFDFVGLPLKMKGATGSPVRAIARV
jgi:kynurenine formamidase